VPMETPLSLRKDCRPTFTVSRTAGEWIAAGDIIHKCVYGVLKRPPRCLHTGTYRDTAPRELICGQSGLRRHGEIQERLISCFFTGVRGKIFNPFKGRITSSIFTTIEAHLVNWFRNSRSWYYIHEVKTPCAKNVWCSLANTHICGWRPERAIP